MDFATMIALGVGVATLIVGTAELYASELKLRAARRVLAQARRLNAARPTPRWEVKTTTYRTPAAFSKAEISATLWAGLVRWAQHVPGRALEIEVESDRTRVWVRDEHGTCTWDGDSGGLDAQIDRIVRRVCLTPKPEQAKR